MMMSRLLCFGMPGQWELLILFGLLALALAGAATVVVVVVILLAKKKADSAPAGQQGSTENRHPES